MNRDDRAGRRCARFRLTRTAPVLILALLLAGCGSSPPPPRSENICGLVKENPRWHKHANRASDKWKAPVPLLFAIINQESSFRAKAKPPRKRFLGIPTRRPSTAFGFPQALDITWDVYRRSSGNRIAKRDRFKDAVDFVGWYVHQSNKKNGIPRNDAYNNYLAYHEGWGGYERATYKKKPWLERVAKKVATVAFKYQKQLESCRS